MKTNYKSGKYKLTMENHIPGFNNIEFILNLTSIQAKVLMKNHFYSDLGFKEIEFVSEN